MGKEVEGCDIVVAVAGQPNVGKSTLFNVLTGQSVRVSNWAGTTVEKKTGMRVHRGRRICFVDLPGIYGLSALSIDEKVARSYLLSGEAHAVLVLVDSTAPERTIYLALQVLELVPRAVVALTKSDLAHGMGIHIHVDKLESKLGVPVIATSAIQGTGIDEMLDALIDVAEGRRGRGTTLRIAYDGLEPYIAEVEKLVSGIPELGRYPSRWLALRLLEGDPELEEVVRKAGGGEVLEKIRRLREEARRALGRSPEEVAASSRYRFADELLRDVVVRVEVRAGPSIVDRVFEKPIVGPLAAAATIFSVFLVAFIVNTGFPLNVIADLAGAPEVAEALESYSLSGLLGMLFDWLAEGVRAWLGPSSPALASLLADGVIGGVGAVLSFLPLIMIVAAFMAAVEDSGLGPRIAMALHGFFSRFGLSGKSAYPMFISLGCNVPGVLGSRVAIDTAERMEVVLSVPFVPCQARLVVALFAVSAFLADPGSRAAALTTVYVVGLLVFLLSSLFLRRVVFRVSEPPELLIEVPPLHSPNLKVVWWITWDTTKHFLRKAGIVIFGLSIVTWALLSYGPTGPVEDVEHSYAAILGAALAPVLTPLFGLSPDSAWKVGFALINGFVAKEGLVSAIAIMAGVSEESAFAALGLNTAQGLALLLFLMLYVPCLATLAMIYQETRSWKWTLFSIAYMLFVATVVSEVAYLALLPFT